MRVANASLSTFVRAFNQGDRMLRGLGHGTPALSPDLLLGYARRHTRLTEVGLQDIGGPLDRVADVAYSELVASPIATVERLYEHLGWTAGRRNIASRAIANASKSGGKEIPNLGQSS